jgi:acetolactate synthase-like protein
VLGGAAAGILKGRGALQDIDQINLFHSICKFSATVKTVREIVPTLRKALHIAQSGTPGNIFLPILSVLFLQLSAFTGPVFIEFPLDVLYPYELVKRELFNIPESKKLKGKIINWCL